MSPQKDYTATNEPVPNVFSTAGRILRQGVVTLWTSNSFHTVSVDRIAIITFKWALFMSVRKTKSKSSLVHGDIW